MRHQRSAGSSPRGRGLSLPREASPEAAGQVPVRPSESLFSCSRARGTARSFHRTDPGPGKNRAETHLPLFAPAAAPATASPHPLLTRAGPGHGDPPASPAAPPSGQTDSPALRRGEPTLHSPRSQLTKRRVRSPGRASEPSRRCGGGRHSAPNARREPPLPGAFPRPGRAEMAPSRRASARPPALRRAGPPSARPVSRPSGHRGERRWRTLG